MSTITKEQLRERARQKVKSLELAVTQSAFADSRAELEEELELARIALASLEAEAVCVIDQSNLDYLKSGSDADVWPASRTEMGDVLLYRAAPPAPVSVPAAMGMDDDFDSAFEHGKAAGWNACRAAMLQGSQHVSQTYNLPELIEGMEVSIDVSTCDADLGNRYFGTVTEALELDTAKNGYILLVQDAEPNFDINGNSPVTPDGWVMVPKELTPEMMRAVQIRSELGGYATSNLSGAYNMFSEFWNVAVSAAPKVDDL